MAAWVHSNKWSPTVYQQYRDYVATTAPTLKGRTEDCADLSMYLLVEFAATHGLCLTLQDDGGVRYISKAPAQIPGGWIQTTLKWSTKDEYYAAVKQRLGAKALFQYNTVANKTGPQPGDLMISTGHAALIFAYYPPAVLHPKAADLSITDFPADPADAAKQLNTLEYIKSRTLNGHSHIDYLNHRGTGGKVQAELIYFADVDNMKSLGFEYRKYLWKVIDNWDGWNGTGDPPY